MATLPTWITHKHVALRPVDSPSLAAYKVTLSKAVSLAKRTVPNTDTLIRSGL